MQLHAFKNVQLYICALLGGSSDHVYGALHQEPGVRLYPCHQQMFVFTHPCIAFMVEAAMILNDTRMKCGAMNRYKKKTH